MWKNSLKNVESDNNKFFYETLLDIFYRETVLTFWISLVIKEIDLISAGTFSAIPDKLLSQTSQDLLFFCSFLWPHQSPPLPVMHHATGNKCIWNGIEWTKINILNVAQVAAGRDCPHIAKVVYIKQRTEQNREQIWPSCSLDMAVINVCRRPFYAKRISVNN
jgi:hypothetical protein